MFKKYKDAILGIAVILLGIGLYIMSFGIKSVALNLIKADFFPRLIAGLFVILGLILLATGLKKAKTYVEPEEKVLPFWKNDGTVSMLETLLLIAVYMLLMKSVGFIIMTFLYLVAQMFVMTPKEKRTKKNLLLFVGISLVASFGIYLLFVRVFYLMLPAGILPIY